MKLIFLALITLLSLNVMAQDRTEEIARIRKIYNYTSVNYKKMKHISKDLDAENPEGGTLDFYYLNKGEYNLIIKTVYNQTGKIITEYYFGINNYLNFMFEQSVIYNASIISKTFDAKKSKKIITKYYVKDDTVFKVVDGKNKPIKKNVDFCEALIEDIRGIVIATEDKN